MAHAALPVGPADWAAYVRGTEGERLAGQSELTLGEVAAPPSFPKHPSGNEG